MPDRPAATRHLILGSSADQDGVDAFDQFFDYHRYEGDNTDATTQSDLFSDENSVTCPTAQTAASSVGAAPDVEEDTVMSGAVAAPELHKELPWPQDSDSGLPPRDPTIQDQDALTPHGEIPAADMGPPEGPGYSNTAPGSVFIPAADTHNPAPRPRTRRLDRPEKTKEVRERGACAPCKISRVSCGAEGVCPKCVAVCKDWPGVDAGRICTRGALHDVVGGLAKRWCWNDTGLLAPSSSQFTNESVTVLIYFSEDSASPPLKIDARVFIGPGGHQRLGIRAGDGPSRDDDIYQWAKSRLMMNHHNGFESCIERLLVSFVDRTALQHVVTAETGTQSVNPTSLSFVGSQVTWLKKLLRMRCMWEVWRCRKFYISRGSSTFLFPESYQAVQEYLHQYAAESISELEKDVLKELDKLVSAQNGVRSAEHPLLWSAHNIAMWVSLWQLIFVYRQSLKEMFYQQPADAAPILISGAPSSSRRDQFRKRTGELYNKTSVLYSGFFRTSKMFDDLKGAGDRVFRSNHNLRQAFQQAWEARIGFYDNFEPTYPGDEVIKTLIMEKETKVLNRKRPNRKVHS